MTFWPCGTVKSMNNAFALGYGVDPGPWVRSQDHARRVSEGAARAAKASEERIKAARGKSGFHTRSGT